VNVFTNDQGTVFFKTTFDQEYAFSLNFEVHVQFLLLSSHFLINIYNILQGGFETSLQFDFTSNAYPTFTSTAGWYWNSTGDQFDVYTECISTPMCPIPIDSVANGVVSAFEKFINDLPTTVVDKLYKNLLPKLQKTNLIPKLKDGLFLNLQGDLSVPNQDWNAPDITLDAKGSFSQTASGPYAPFTAQIVPPILSSPPSQVGLMFTDYFFQSLIWALQSSGDLSFVFDQSNLPANSSFQLNTNNKEFLLLAPGLKNFPNMNISLLFTGDTTSITNFHISQGGGIELSDMVFDISFVLSNATVTNQFAFSVKLNSTVSLALNSTCCFTIDLTLLPDQSMFVVSLNQSDIGKVNTGLLEKLITEIFREISQKAISFDIKAPTKLTNPVLGDGDGYFSYFADTKNAAAILEEYLGVRISDIILDAFSQIDVTSDLKIDIDLPKKTSSQKISTKRTNSNQ